MLVAQLTDRDPSGPRIARLMLTLGFLFASSFASSQTKSPDAQVAMRIEHFVRPFVESANFTGVILVERGGATAFEKAYGLANYELQVPNTARTRFHIASVSKAFTAAGILLLQERRQLSVEDPVSKFVPDFPNGATIQVGHLLRHTSGIVNTSELSSWNQEERNPHTPAQLVELFKDKPLQFTPGSQYRYSNSNYNLLALILERVSGLEYGEFLRQNVFDPLGLRSTLHDGDMARLIPHRASGTEPDGIAGMRAPRYIDWSARTGNGSLVTTAHDLANFVDAVFAGRLLKPSSVATLLADAPGFAFGWLRDERFGRKQVRCGGRSPGFNASVERYLDDGMTIIVLSNSYSPVAQDPVFLNGLHSAAFGRAVEPPSLRPVRVKRGSLSEFVGTYQLPQEYFIPNTTLTLQDKGDHLEGIWANGAVNTIFPIDAVKFLDRNFWADVTFEKNAEGQVTGFNYEIAQQRFAARRIAPVANP